MFDIHFGKQYQPNLKTNNNEWGKKKSTVIYCFSKIYDVVEAFYVQQYKFWMKAKQ